jgi:hypothetical protein
MGWKKLSDIIVKTANIIFNKNLEKPFLPGRPRCHLLCVSGVHPETNPLKPKNGSISGRIPEIHKKGYPPRF